jgi:hypothetical protein
MKIMLPSQLVNIWPRLPGGANDVKGRESMPVLARPHPPVAPGACSRRPSAAAGGLLARVRGGWRLARYLTAGLTWPFVLASTFAV